jgi:hypothetical protein
MPMFPRLADQAWHVDEKAANRTPLGRPLLSAPIVLLRFLFAAIQTALAATVPRLTASRRAIFRCESVPS